MLEYSHIPLHYKSGNIFSRFAQSHQQKKLVPSVKIDKKIE